MWAKGTKNREPGEFDLLRIAMPANVHRPDYDMINEQDLNSGEFLFSYLLHYCRQSRHKRALTNQQQHPRMEDQLPR